MKTLDEYIKTVKNDKELHSINNQLSSVIKDLSDAENELNNIQSKEYYNGQATAINELKIKIEFLKSKLESLKSEKEVFCKKYGRGTVFSVEIAQEFENEVFDSLNEDELKKQVVISKDRADDKIKILSNELENELKQLNTILGDEVIQEVINSVEMNNSIIYRNALITLTKSITQLLKR